MVFDIAVIGGGAAGLAASIFAARSSPALSIVVLEGAKKPGAKILISGGGRCNVTNAVVTERDFFGGSPRIVRRVLRAFGVAETVAFFRELSVALQEEKGGKLFPVTDSARTVLDALLAEAGRRRVRPLFDHRVEAIGRGAGEGFRVKTPRETFTASRVVLAAGGKSFPKTGSDGAGYDIARSLGHSIVPPVPALAPLVLDGGFHAPLSGVSHEAEIAVRIEGAKPIKIRGAILWTHFGISGPAAMNASRVIERARHDGRAFSVEANLLPGEDADARLLALAKEHPGAKLHTALARLFPSRVAEAVLHELRIESCAMARLPKEARRRLASALAAWPLPVKASRGFDFAEATAGGVPLGEINPATMESRRCPGLFLVGEILDVDGRIGGFNFQWAWSSGYVAGRALASAPRRPVS